MIFSSQPVLFEVVEAQGTYPEGSCLMAGPDRSYILAPLSNIVDEAYTVGCAMVYKVVHKACTWAAGCALPDRMPVLACYATEGSTAKGYVTRYYFKTPAFLISPYCAVDC